MKQTFKKISKSKFFINFISKVISVYLFILYKTIRWQNNSDKLLEKYKNEKIILFFWHGRMLMMPFIWKNPKNMHVLISYHSDGELIAKVIENIGYKLIRGSSSKGGISALKSIISTLKIDAVAITPDGPRGPKMKINGNLLAIAKISGAPIILATYSCERAKMLNTWDGMIIPKFFSKGYVSVSEPIYIPPQITAHEIENKQQEIEQIINEMTEELDKISGIS